MAFLIHISFLSREIWNFFTLSEFFVTFSDTLPSANSSFSSKTVGFDQESANLSDMQLESEISITDFSSLSSGLGALLLLLLG